MTGTAHRSGGVSVVIPTFNRAGYVVEAVDSALRQTEPPLEVIVVDDGSIDRTAEVLAPYGDRIRYIRQENRGEAAARNRGIAAARGEWVAFLDSDDRWEPHALQTLRRASERHPGAGVIAMRARRMLPDGTITDRISGKKTPGPFFSTSGLLGVDSGGVQTPMVRRVLFEQVGGFDESLSAPDVDMWLRLSFHTTVVGVPEPLLLWRIHEGNISGDLATNARMWLRILDKFARDHPDFVRTHRWACRRAAGKARLRLGRELLACVTAEDASGLAEARLWLRRSVAVFPFFLRAWVYLVWSCLAPVTYAGWRRRERRRRRGGGAAQGSRPA